MARAEQHWGGGGVKIQLLNEPKLMKIPENIHVFLHINFYVLWENKDRSSHRF